MEKEQFNELYHKHKPYAAMFKNGSVTKRKNDLTSEQLTKDVQAFLDRGGRVAQIKRENVTVRLFKPLNAGLFDHVT